MKTKREVLEEIAKNGDCENINCKKECPYCFSDKCLDLDLRKIGAMAILRMFKEKKKKMPSLENGTKIKFSDGSVATISKVDCGVICFYALVFGDKHKEYIDYLIGKTWEVVE